MEVVALSQEISKIVGLLVTQDEADRASLALIAPKQQQVSIERGNNNNGSMSAADTKRPTYKDNKKYIDLDKSCLTCSSNPTDIKSLFKIACLSYNPT